MDVVIENILNNYSNTQLKTITFVGQRGFSYPDSTRINDFTINNINSKINDSYLLFDLNNNKFVFNSINHLVLRKCINCTIILDKSISGIDIINCSNIVIFIPQCNYMDITSSSIININTNLLENFFITNSINIFVNNNDLNANPFLGRYKIS